ncbi:hypothetical protein [Leisingera sp. S232]|uniref:hypothetical protein n=1 Tax=Leisingera sp. S232 TaxID=3415132 RepID=UPI00086BD288|nr:hypothetical protein AB838_04555 [Rhodobacteraceae bacterium (ex Bugula neritina AB1)]
MRIGSNALSMQYHVEVEPDTVDNWAAIPAYREALIAAMGETGVADMRDAAATQMAGFLAAAEQLYSNFMKAAAA